MFHSLFHMMKEYPLNDHTEPTAGSLPAVLGSGLAVLKRQNRDWKITVLRTALDKLAYAYRILWKPVTTWQSISSALQQKNPVIILVNIKKLDAKPYPDPHDRTGKKGECNHWVVITGYDDKNIYINNPLAQKDFVACQRVPQCGQNWRVGYLDVRKGSRGSLPSLMR
jgi:hypothetical protein